MFLFAVANPPRPVLLSMEVTETAKCGGPKLLLLDIVVGRVGSVDRAGNPAVSGEIDGWDPAENVPVEWTRSYSSERQR